MSSDETPQIKNIAKFKKMREEMKGMKYIKTALPVVSPVLRLLGVDTKEIKEAFKDLDKLEKEFKEISETPDIFNDVFASRGWIMYGFLNMDVAKEAISLAQTDIEAAEQYLVDFYTPDLVETYLRMMHGVKAFRPRMELAEKALIDYKEKRYHACVPVVLALMDGLVNDLQHLGLFSEGANLTAWDCITAHEKGLNSLKETLYIPRKKTRTEEITIPYRNGILHGMDLGYANKMVAAKTWAALFSVRDWAAKAESNELVEPPPKPQTSWTELMQQVQENKNLGKQLEQWQPRNIIVGKDVPETGNSEEYLENTPERTVVEFLNYWQMNNYGYMTKCIASTLNRSGNELVKRVRDVYSSSKLNSFTLLSIKDEAPAISVIDVLLNYEHHTQHIEKEVSFRVLIERLDGKPAMFGSPDAKWGIVIWGVI